MSTNERALVKDVMTGRALMFIHESGKFYECEAEAVPCTKAVLEVECALDSDNLPEFMQRACMDTFRNRLNNEHGCIVGFA